MWRKALAQPLQPDARRRGSTVGVREEKECGLAAKRRRGARACLGTTTPEDTRKTMWSKAKGNSELAPWLR
jgi:hypothetical protein